MTCPVCKPNKYRITVQVAFLQGTRTTRPCLSGRVVVNALNLSLGLGDDLVNLWTYLNIFFKMKHKNMKFFLYVCISEPLKDIYHEHSWFYNLIFLVNVHSKTSTRYNHNQPLNAFVHLCTHFILNMHYFRYYVRTWTSIMSSSV